MKAKFLMFTAVLCAIHGIAGAVTIKKAAPVSTQKKEVLDNGSSLLPGVLNLVGAVQQLNQQKKALQAECIPSSSDIQFVNKMVQEWAKTGAKTADDVFSSLGVDPCEDTDSYEDTVQASMGELDDDDICYDAYNRDEDDGAIWYGMPKAATATYCDDGINVKGCAEKYKKTTSNIYEVFAVVGFSDSDYSAEELTKFTKLKEKMDKCAPAKVKARQRESMANLVNQTLGSVGTKTDTANLMQSVTSLVGSMGSGTNGVVQSLVGVAQDMLIKE